MRPGQENAIGQLLPLITAQHATIGATEITGLYRIQGSPVGLGVLRSQLAGLDAVSYVEAPQPLHLTAISPGDPSYAAGSQWGLNGAFGINAPQAWDVSRGSLGVTAAILDTGIDYNHPDLYQNIWLNQAEIPPSRLANLTDVDGDGKITFRDLNDPRNQGPFKITDVNHDSRIDAGDVLAPMQKDAQGHDTGLGGWADGISEDGDTAHVDDLVGWNFLANNNDPMDLDAHGTHVAGTIGAQGDNGAGVAGINWQIQLMAVKLFEGNSYVGPDAVAEALQYAERHGARVSNNSYAGEASPTLQTAIQQAATWNYGQGQGVGMVFVAAAGNFAMNNDTYPVYPANYASPNVLSVAATDVNGKLASFSDYGATTVDVGAPGVDILSTTPGKSYGLASGTSMATPHAAGVAALLLAQNPTWNADQVVSRIIASATPASTLAGKTVSGGIVNAAAALGAQGNTSQGNTIVNLGTAFNRLSIAADGSTFLSYGGIDTSGHALSANLLGSVLTWNGIPFSFGSGNTLNAVAAAGQTVSLPTGSWSSLSFLATSAWNNYTNQTFRVNYTDGTSQTFTQSFSVWTAPQHYPGESLVVTMPYRDNANGSQTSTPVYVYAYQFALNSSKQVRSITLPNQAKINILAVTLGGSGGTTLSTPPAPGVSLAASFNRTGIVRDGTTFSGGIDAAGHAYSAGLLGSALNWNGAIISLGAANAANVVAGSGQTINLPAGHYAALSLLATGVNGSQTNQTFTITYADGSTQSFTQSLSDWTAPQGFTGESVAASLAYRDNANGSQTAQRVFVYGYRLVLDAGKQVRSIRLPASSNVVVLGMGLTLAQPNAVAVPLSPTYNRTGIAKGGVHFSGGLDGNGHAYFNGEIRSFIAYNGQSFGLGNPGETNAVDVTSASGQTINLPAGRYAALSLLATGVNGSQTNQTFTVTYADGSTQSFTQSLSDWMAPASFAGESVVASLTTVCNADGTADTSHRVYAYGYRFALDASKPVQSITLPVNSNVEVLAIGLS
jgi:subtilisin family serine protease